MDNSYYEEELEEKDKEINLLETQLDQCQREIRRLHSVCRDYQKCLEDMKSQICQQDE